MTKSDPVDDVTEALRRIADALEVFVLARYPTDDSDAKVRALVALMSRRWDTLVQEDDDDAT